MAGVLAAACDLPCIEHNGARPNEACPKPLPWLIVEKPNDLRSWETAMLLPTIEAALRDARDQNISITLLGDETPVEGQIKALEEDGLVLLLRGGAHCGIPFHAIKRIMF